MLSLHYPHLSCLVILHRSNHLSTRRPLHHLSTHRTCRTSHCYTTPSMTSHCQAILVLHIPRWQQIPSQTGVCWVVWLVQQVLSIVSSRRRHVRWHHAEQDEWCLHGRLCPLLTCIRQWFLLYCIISLCLSVWCSVIFVLIYFYSQAAASRYCFCSRGEEQFFPVFCP